jgi:hypothetical protein
VNSRAADVLASGGTPSSTCSYKKESNHIESITDSPRFIPNREGQDLQASFSLLHDEGSPATPSKQKKRTPHGELHFQKSKIEIKFYIC